MSLLEYIIKYFYLKFKFTIAGVGEFLDLHLYVKKLSLFLKDSFLVISSCLTIFVVIYLAYYGMFYSFFLFGKYEISPTGFCVILMCNLCIQVVCSYLKFKNFKYGLMLLNLMGNGTLLVKIFVSEVLCRDFVLKNSFMVIIRNYSIDEYIRKAQEILGTDPILSQSGLTLTELYYKLQPTSMKNWKVQVVDAIKELYKKRQDYEMALYDNLNQLVNRLTNETVLRKKPETPMTGFFPDLTYTELLIYSSIGLISGIAVFFIGKYVFDVLKNKKEVKIPEVKEEVKIPEGKEEVTLPVGIVEEIDPKFSRAYMQDFLGNGYERALTSLDVKQSDLEFRFNTLIQARHVMLRKAIGELYRVIRLIVSPEDYFFGEDGNNPLNLRMIDQEKKGV